MKRLYIAIVCQILAPLLFLTSHFLLTIYYCVEITYYYVMFYCDLSLFIAIGLEIVSIILLISVIETCYKWKNQKEV